VEEPGKTGPPHNVVPRILHGLSDLSPAVLGVVDLGSLVHIFHPVAEHVVDQSGQLSGHGLDCNWGAELGSESAKLGSQIGIAYP
jgi:hypothetical protein